VLGPRSWWPTVSPTVAGAALGELTSYRELSGRPDAAVVSFPDAGMFILRTPAGDDREIWCRCDGGPHGFLSIAAHAHADALSVEVRSKGVDLLVDPGTYCYHGEPAWRSYFRSTLAHNTIEVDGANQSVEGGPFLWSSCTDAVVDRVELGQRVQTWSGHHWGYARLDAQLRLDRSVAVDPDQRTVTVTDTLTGAARHTLRLAWQIGPEVRVSLTGGVARLAWLEDSTPRSGLLRLPEQLTWSAHSGETDPILGWYSPRFGERVPATTLIGTGTWNGVLRLQTVLDLADDA
ncbi:MAG TPA: heparinase II/III-family protein, partial [Pedococcus sp.]|nr:heparinase II/III-family protein [Pedococcus sp.]